MRLSVAGAAVPTLRARLGLPESFQPVPGRDPASLGDPLCIWGVCEGPGQPAGNAHRRWNAVRSTPAHGQCRGRRSLTPRAWVTILPATWKRRYLRRLGSAVESGVPSSSSILAHATRSHPVSTNSSPSLVHGEGAEGQVAKPGRLGAPDRVLDGGTLTVHLLQTRDAGSPLVGEHDLEAVTVDVCEGELGSGMRTLAAADRPRARRPG